MKTVILCICFLAGSFVLAQEKTKEISPSTIGTKSIAKQESNIWDVFKNRRSVRKYTSDTIPEADIVKIIDAARMAPTSGNQQPWKFLVIRDKSKIDQMKEACIKMSSARYDTNVHKNFTREQFEKRVRSNFDNYCSAPVYIVILTDNGSTYPDYNHWDGPLAAGYLMLAARAMGYGTVFITDAIPDEVTKKVFNIPDTYTRVCITPLGIPVEWPSTPKKKNLEEFISYENF
jgi:nitroreductase